MSKLEQVTYTDNLGNEFIADVMLPCPFCGGEAKLEMIGNNYSKTKKARIKCKKCHVQRVDAAIINDQVWCGKTVIKQWNTRTGH
jgi:transposase-like protein